MFSKFSEEAQKVLMMAKQEMVALRHPYVGSEHLLLAILKNKTNEVSRKLAENHANYQTIRDEVISLLGVGDQDTNWFLYTPLLKRILESAMIEARENHDEEVTVVHLFLAMLEEGEGVAIRVLLSFGVDVDEIYQFFFQHPGKIGKHPKKLAIDEFAVDFVEQAKKGEIDPVVCREEELLRLIETLSRRSKNNPVLIGEAGVGKTAIVEELARRISLGLVPDRLRGCRLLSLSIAGLVAGTKYRGEFEERLNKLLKEVEENQDIILFVDEIHTLVGAGGAEGAIDASNILKPILARGKIRLIGATTTQEYKQFIEKDKAFARRFQTIVVEEPDLDRTITILKQLKPLYEGYHHVVLTDEILLMIVQLSNQYIFNRKQPDKSIDLLDEVCAKVSLMEDKDLAKLSKWKEKLHTIQTEKNEAIIQQDFKKAGVLKEKEQCLEDQINRLELKLSRGKEPRVVQEGDIISLVQAKTKIPVYGSPSNPNHFFHLEESLKKVIIGQEKAVLEICNQIKREQFGLSLSNRPTSFLFVGPTGVGKTKLVKEYAKLSVGEEHFIRLDMNEYKESHSISRIIGAPPGYVGYTDSTCVLEQIKTYPYSILLLDEIEKAHPSIVQLFLQALDEGRMKTAGGEEVRFDHVIVFMTSNIGYHKNNIGFSEFQAESVHSKLKEILSIEFLNRIQHVILFQPLSKEAILKIINLELKRVKKVFSEKGISLVIKPSVSEEILMLSQYEEFGARKISSIVEQKVDMIVIDQILDGHQRVKVESIL